jgi:urease accessory protein UreF
MGTPSSSTTMMTMAGKKTYTRRKDALHLSGGKGPAASMRHKTQPTRLFRS